MTVSVIEIYLTALCAQLLLRSHGTISLVISKFWLGIYLVSEHQSTVCLIVRALRPFLYNSLRAEHPELIMQGLRLSDGVQWPVNWSLASYEDVGEFFQNMFKDSASPAAKLSDVMSTSLTVATPETSLDDAKKLLTKVAWTPSCIPNILSLCSICKDSNVYRTPQGSLKPMMHSWQTISMLNL